MEEAHPTPLTFDVTELERYLAQWIDSSVEIEQIQALGSGRVGAAALKGIGYGRPVCIDFHCKDGAQRAVLRQVKQDGFGHELQSDRIAILWRDFHSFNTLPNHVGAHDLIALNRDGTLVSARHIQDMMLLTDFAPGQIYAEDLARARDEGDCSELDRQRALALALYLAEIHAVKLDDALLWRRRLRDLLGHGEGIMGQTDNYPADFHLAGAADLQALEDAANAWRWRLKPLTHRLSQVHGDYHPFNILFTSGVDFTLLDRSRGEWGAPEDDVSCMVINYLFFSLQRYGCLAEPFDRLYKLFWSVYLERTQDHEILQTIQPWFAWRALVLASPVWYPTLTDEVRRKLLIFARQVMAADVFDWRAINRYLEG